MNLSLYITKNYNLRDYQKPAHIRFAVIDNDISKQYPANFVCILPRKINPKAKNPTKFQIMFKDQSKDLTKKLLNQALENTDDQELKKELLARLKILNPKPKNLAKCNVCGKDFQAKKYRYGRQKTCYECKPIRYTDKAE